MRLLVATDGSELSLQAARRASDVLRDASDVTVVTAIPEVPGDDAGGIEGPTESGEQVERHWEELADANAAVEATVQALDAPEVQRRVEAGDPGPAICGVARDIGADTVVIGSHGRGLLKQMVLGSVSEYVVRHAPCPVLVVRQP